MLDRFLQQLFSILGKLVELWTPVRTRSKLTRVWGKFSFKRIYEVCFESIGSLFCWNEKAWNYWVILNCNVEFALQILWKIQNNSFFGRWEIPTWFDLRKNISSRPIILWEISKKWMSGKKNHKNNVLMFSFYYIGRGTDILIYQIRYNFNFDFDWISTQVINFIYFNFVWSKFSKFFFLLSKWFCFLLDNIKLQIS